MTNNNSQKFSNSSVLSFIPHSEFAPTRTHAAGATSKYLQFAAVLRESKELDLRVRFNKESDEVYTRILSNEVDVSKKDIDWIFRDVAKCKDENTQLAEKPDPKFTFYSIKLNIPRSKDRISG